MSYDWLYNAFILITAAVLVVPLAKRGGLGSVLGYLLAGVAIGPFGLRLIADPEDILHVAEFGVIMMLFLIGLELQPRILWRLRRSIIGLGGMQMLASTAAIAAVAMLCGLHWTDSLLVGLALALSSTAVALQILNEKGQLQTHTGQSSFSVLLFQDIAVVPILALVPVLAAFSSESATQAIETVIEGVLSSTVGEERGAVWESWLDPIQNLSMVIMVLIVSHFALRPMLRVIAKTGMQELFTAFALLIVIGVTLLMVGAGLSAALGAFLAGVMLAESEYRHEIEHEIKPFKSILLALFFMSVGMSIGFDAILYQPFVIIGILLGLFALKLIVLIGIGMAFRMDKTQFMPFALLLAQGGEFAFVILKLASDTNFIDQNVEEILIVICALSMALTPVLFMLYDRFILPRLASTFSTLTPATDLSGAVSDKQSVMILGFGRFGQVVGRLLHAQGYPLTILDHDPEQIEMTRRFGFKVYYGDSADIPLLETAGLAQARLVVVTVDDPSVNVSIVRAIKEKYPNLTVLARARDRRHAYELTKAGADGWIRETFESALRMAGDVMHHLGVDAETAQARMKKFAEHDSRTLEQSFAFFDNETELVTFSKRSRAELENMFAYDAAHLKKASSDPV